MDTQKTHPDTTWNHLIPEHYLKGWLIERDNQKRTWVNYKRTIANPHLPASHRKSIDRIGTKRHFYSQAIEDMLAHKIEAPAAPILNKIRGQILPSSDERLIITRYITNFLNRVEYGKKRYVSRMPAHFDLHFTEANLAHLLGRQPSVEEVLKLMDIRKRWESSKEKEMEFYAELLQPEALPMASACLQQMRWQFLVNTSQSTCFLTCDNPVFYFHDIGIGSLISEVSFPISSKITLWASYNMDLLEGFFPVSPEIVEEINSRTVANATNEIYSSINGTWIKGLAIRVVVPPRRIVHREGVLHSIPKLA